jgi:hypothetical protein
MGRKRGFLLLILLFAVLTLAVAIPQHRAFRLREAQLIRQIKDISALLDANREYPLEMLVNDLADTCLQLDRAAQWVPAFFPAGNEAFAGEIKRLATDHGITATLSPPLTGQRDFYMQTDLPIVLEGRSADLESFVQAVENHPRLIDWRLVCIASVGESAARQRVIARIRIFAFSPAGTKRRLSSKNAERKGTAVWLPPYAGKIATLERRLADLEQQASRLRDWPRWKKVFQDFREARMDLQKRVAVVNALLNDARSFDTAFVNSMVDCDEKTRPGASAHGTGTSSQTQ